MGFRYDIQALRGFAVLIILLYHAGLGPLGAGYLGVDVFFVISGFLITSLLIKHIEQKDFSFAEFYFRRAKRLLPAAYVVLLLTTLASLLFLTPGQYQGYKNQLLGSLSFTANLALYDQADYFSSAAKEKPLLHMWSLSIEEQFYLILPLFLFFVPQRLWRPFLSVAFIASLGLCLARVQNHPDHTFYFIPTRAWELLLGCLAAVYPAQEKAKKLYRLLFYPAIGLLIAIPLFPISGTHPGIDALAVCLATFIIIQRRTETVGIPVLPVRALSLIGNYSYSLYLVHWPIFAYAYNASITGEISANIRATLLSVSVIAAIALYHLVERPIHYHTFKLRRNLVIPLVIASIALAGMGLAVRATHSNNPEYDNRLQPNLGLGGACDHKKDYKKLPQCQTNEAPEILVWGDSYAMHLIPGLAAQKEIGIAQGTRRACSPFTTAAYSEPPKYSTSWSEKCIRFNRDILDTLKEWDSIKIVVISSIFEKVNNPQLDGVGFENGIFVSRRMGPDSAVQSMAETVREIRALGKKVVIVSPPPKNKINVGMCLEKLRMQKVIFGTEESCSLHLDKAREEFSDVYAFIDRLPQEADVDVIKLSDYLCENNRCTSSINGTIIYKDDGHITNKGSLELVKKIDLLGLIEKHAR